MDFNDEKLVNDIDIMVLISNISYLSSSENLGYFHYLGLERKLRETFLGDV